MQIQFGAQWLHNHNHCFVTMEALRKAKHGNVGAAVPFAHSRRRQSCNHAEDGPRRYSIVSVICGPSA